MHSRFDEFKATPLGRQLEALIDTDARYAEYAALSRAEVPAIAAIVHDLRDRFPEVESDPTARQFCGAAVAEVLRRHGHEVLRPRGRVPGGYFTYGVVWSPLPVQRSYQDLLAELAAMPKALSSVIEGFPASALKKRPKGTGFSVLEHVCHLRDLDQDAYRLRADLILKSDQPVLHSVDGTKWAEERGYLKQDLKSALAAFKKYRASLVARFSRLSEKERRRFGLFDGVKRMSIDDLVLDICNHDRIHRQELDDLAAEIVKK